MSLSHEATKIINALAKKPSYVREISEQLGLSTRTTVKWLHKFKARGLTKSFKRIEGKGKPNEYHHLTTLGKKLSDILDQARFIQTFYTLKQADIPSCAGIGCSCGFWGAPIMLRQLDVAVRDTDKHEAKKIVEGQGFRIHATQINDFFKRRVTSDGISYLSPEDAIIHILLTGDIGLALLIPIIICKNKIDYEILHSLSLKHQKNREVGAMLETTNVLKKKKITPPNIIRMFQTVERAHTRIVKKKPHKFTLAGVVPRRKNSINKTIERKWGVNIPTFEELKETFELGT